MFPVKTYVSRRAELRAKTGGGLILLPGNQPSANNYPNNAYYFRQDSTFLYYFGLDRPSLAGVIDADTGEEVLFGDDFTVDDIIWTGPQPTLREEGARAGVADCRPLAALADYLAAAIRLGRRIHYLPPYRGETKLQLSALLGINPNTVQKAFHLLEEEQLIESRTGAKSCMTLPEKTLAALRQELLSEELRNAARTLRQMGITKEDALRLLAQAWEEEET